jgi:hypothetical protein
VARETKKVQRSREKQEKLSGKAKRAQLGAPPKASTSAAPVDPLGPAQLRSMWQRVGLILLGLWVVGGLIALMSQSQTLTWTSLGLTLVLSGVVVGVLLWTLRRARSAKEVASLLQGVTTAEDRVAALSKLEAEGSKDPAKLFAKAQLEMATDPKKALQTLEQLDLNKHAGTVADEARGQRAMIHLTLGQVGLARQLVDNIDLKRSQDPRARAMLSAIAAEAFARSGDAERGQTLLSAFELGDASLAELRPQLLRAQAFCQVHAGKLKELKRTLKQLMDIDVRLLGGFLQGKSHPLLQKEAKRMVEQSGLVPRRMQVQRMH